MIIWCGRGYLVAVATFLCLVTSEYITESVMQDDKYYQTHGWPKTLAFFVAAFLTGLVALWIKSSGARRLIDPETGEDVYVGGNDSLFLIPVRHWTWLLVVLGGLFWFVRDP